MVTFDVRLDGGLSTILNRPITKLLVTAGPQGRPGVVRFSYADGAIIRVRPEMHTLAERIEVGALEFDDAPVLEGEICEAIQLRPSFVATDLRKLIITESGVQVESGLKLLSDGDRSLIVVAGVYPYTLAIFGLPPREYFVDPEYDQLKYAEIALT